jgi:hypothetical protein
MTIYVTANNVSTTLAAASSSSSTTFTLASNAGLPTLSAGQVMPLTLNDAATGQTYEIVYVTAISGVTLTVVRAQEGTGAQNWNVGDFAFCAPTAGTVADVNGNPNNVFQVAPATLPTQASQFSQVVGIAGSAVNLKCVTTATGTALPYSADQILVASALNGLTYALPSFNVSISALDTGALAANSYYAVYAYLKSDGTQGGFLQLEPAGGAPTVYGGTHAPANMIASGLIGVWATNGSAQFLAGSQHGRYHFFVPRQFLNTTTVNAALTSTPCTTVPKSAIRASLSTQVSPSTTTGMFLVFAADATGTGSRTTGGLSQSGTGIPGNFDLDILTPQVVYTQMAIASGTLTSTASVAGYWI